MSNTDICTCDYFPHCQDVICMTCGKSQKHAGEVLRQLMAENERLHAALEALETNKYDHEPSDVPPQYLPDQEEER